MTGSAGQSCEQSQTHAYKLVLLEEKLISLIADRASPLGETIAAVHALAHVQRDLEALGAPRPAPDERKAQRVSKTGGFPATRPGWCAACRGPTSPGDLIGEVGVDAAGKTKWGHAQCAARAA